MLMSSDLIRPHVSVHALVTACCRGFVDVVHTLMKCGVDANATDRVLLQSFMPPLHTNADCTPLVAAVVNRQVSVVRLLLQVGVRSDINVRLASWSWDMATGEEFRVGAGLADPYAITWCAVEYFEVSGAILRMLLQQASPNSPHYGRSLLHHAIQCGNVKAVNVLLSCGADVEFPVKTSSTTEFRPIQMAARLGLSTILKCLIESGCDLNSKTDSGETALMICAEHKHEECFRALAIAGADFGLLSITDQSVTSLAQSSHWSAGFRQVTLDLIRSGNIPKSSNTSVFSPLMFVAQAGDIEALKTLIGWGGINLDYQDDKGFTAVMLTALNGHMEAFRLLVYGGADVKLFNKSGDTALSIAELNQNRSLFEKVMLEFALEKGDHSAGEFYALHCAARHGDLAAARLLTSRGYNVNLQDREGYTPLMLAAKEGHGSMCRHLIQQGAKCNTKNTRGETALSIARKHSSLKSETEHVILDELARKLVLGGANVWKHTKGGKGTPHRKEIRMVSSTGVLRWGNSKRRNVICRDAAVGPSPGFEKIRQRKGDSREPGMFQVKTMRNKEVHFVCDGGIEVAELWARGIKLVTGEAICGKERRLEFETWTD